MRPDFRDRASSALSGGLAAVVLLTLLVGVPAVLVRSVGNPLRGGLPSWERTQWLIDQGGIPVRFWIAALAVLVWICWLQVAVSFLLEVVSLVQQLPPPALPTLGVAQGLVSRLVGVVLVATTLASGPVSGSVAGQPIPIEQVLVDGAGATSSASVSSGRPVSATFSAAAEFSAIHSSATRPSVARASVTRALGGPSSQPAPVASPDAIASLDSGLVSGVPEQVEVGRRSSLRSLAATHLGDAERWAELRDANVGRRMADGTVLDAGFVRLQPGWRLVIPGRLVAPGSLAVPENLADSAESESQHARPAASPQVHLVQAGEHFWAIAEGQLRQSLDREPTEPEVRALWLELLDSNQHSIDSGDVDLLYPGEKVLLPRVAALDASTTSESDETELGRGVVVDEEDGTEASAPVEVHLPSGVPVLSLVAQQLQHTTSEQPAAEASPDLDAIAPEPAAVKVPAALSDKKEAPPGSKASDSPIDNSTQSEPLPARLAAGMAGAGLLSAALVRALRRRRARQWASRPAGQRPLASPEPLLEKDLVAHAETDRLSFVDRVMRSVFADTAAEDRPGISHVAVNDQSVCIVAAQSDSIPLAALDAPALPLGGWEVKRGGPGDPGEPADLPAALPGLVELGTLAGGSSVLVNLAASRVLSVNGSDLAREAFLRTVALQLAVSPLADELDVICCGFGDDLAGLERIRSAPTLDQALDEIRLHDEALWRVLHQPADINGVHTVFLCRHEPTEVELDRLRTLIEGGASVIGASLGDSWSVWLEGDEVRLDPHGLCLTSSALQRAQLDAVGRVLAATEADESEPSPSVPTAVTAAVSSGAEVELSTSSSATVVDLHLVNSGGDLSGEEDPRQQDAQVMALPTGGDTATGDESATGGDTATGDESSTSTAVAAALKVGGEQASEAVMSPAQSTALAPAGDKEIQILGAVSVEGAVRKFNSVRALDVVAFLAFHRDGATADQLRTWIWSFDDAPTDKAFANVMSRARTGLGSGAGGDALLSRAGADGIYRLSKEVGSDFDRFVAAVAQAEELEAQQAIRLLKQALDLVRGVPFTGGGALGFLWADSGSRAHVHFSIDEAVHRCADLANSLGETDLARWAARKGLAVIPGCEGCYQRRFDAAAADGNRSELRAAMMELQRFAAADLGEPESSDVISPSLLDHYGRLEADLLAGRRTSDGVIDVRTAKRETAN